MVRGMELRVKITSSFVYLYGPQIVDYLDTLTKVLGNNYSTMNMPRSKPNNKVKKDKILFFVGTSQYYTIRRPEDFLEIMNNFIENDIKFRIEKLITDYNVPITKYNVSNIMWNGEIRRYIIPVVPIINETIDKLVNGEFIEYEDIYNIIEMYNTKNMIEKYQGEITKVTEKILNEVYEILNSIYYTIMKKIISMYGLDIPDPNKVKKLLEINTVDEETKKIVLIVTEYLVSNPNIQLIGCIFNGDKNCMKEEIEYMTEDIVDLVGEDVNIEDFDKKVRRVLLKLFNNIAKSVNSIDVNLKFIRKLMQSKVNDEFVKRCIEKIIKELSVDIESKNLVKLYLELFNEENNFIDEICENEFSQLEPNERTEKRLLIIDTIRHTLLNTDKILKVILLTINEKSKQIYVKRLKEVVDRATRVDMNELRRILLERFPGKVIYDEKPTVKATEFPGMVIKIRVDPKDYEGVTRTTKKQNTVIIAFPNRKFSITNIRPSTVDIVFEIFKIMDQLTQKEERSLDEIIYI